MPHEALAEWLDTRPDGSVSEGRSSTAVTLAAIGSSILVGWTAVALMFGSNGYMPVLLSSGGGAGGIVDAGAARTDILFWCDHRNAAIDTTQTSANAGTCVNAGDWNRGAVASNWDNAFVVDSSVTDLSGRGWPGSRAFRLRNADGDVSGGAAQVQVKGDSAGLWSTWDTLEVGESQYHRNFYMVDIHDTIAENNHVLETRDASDDPGHHIHYVDTSTDSTGWNLYLRFANPTVSYNFEVRAGGNDHVMPKDTTIMVESQIRRTHVDSATLHARVYVWDGTYTSGVPNFTLRYDDDDFFGFSAASGQLSDSTNYPFTDWSAPQRFRFPLNGWGGGTGGWVGEGWFTGLVCIARDDWCGLYPISGVEN